MANDQGGRTVRAEATLLRIPLFALAVKGSAALDGFEHRQVRRRTGDHSAVDLVVRTERDETTPYPGPLSRRAHMALLSLVTDRGFPFENPVVWTWRELCRRMGLPNSGRRVAELKGAIRASAGLKLFGLDGRARSAARSLYEACEFQNEPRAGAVGIRAVVDANRLWLAPWYLESLNALHSAPLDYGLWKRLEAVGPLASRLYEYLLPSFYRREALQVAYDRLAPAMPVVIQSRRSHAVRQFAAPLEALGSEGVIAHAGWGVMKATGRPKLILARGPRLATEGMSTAAREPATEPAVDPEEAAAMAVEFYRLLGRDLQPLRSDLAVARGLIAKYGADESRARLPDAVKRLKLRFRNAETMGALVRYFDESAREAQRSRDDEARRDRDAASRAAERSSQEHDDARRRDAWNALSEPQRQAERAAVLSMHPTLRRFPPLLDAACLQRLTLPDDGVAGERRERV